MSISLESPHYRVLSSVTFIALLLAGCVLCAPVGAAAEDAPATAAEVIDAAQKSLDALKRWSADMTVDTSMGGMEVSAKGSVQGSGARQVMDMDVDMMGQLGRVKTVVGDDGVQWTETDVNGELNVMKLDMKAITEAAGGNEDAALPGANPSMPQDVTKILASLDKTYDLELKGTELADDTEVYVLEGSLKEEARGNVDPGGRLSSMGIALEKTRVKIGVSDGFLRKSEMIGPDGSVFISITFTNFNANPDFEDSVFNYIPPQGAQVMDMTEPALRQMRGGRPAGH